MTRRLGRMVVVGAIVALALLATGGAALAHPLGNFTTNTYVGLRLHPSGIEVDRVLDLAEVPALQAVQTIDEDGDGEVSATEGEAFATATCAELAEGLSVRVDGVPAAVDTAGMPTLTFPAGEAGLDTLRLECPQAVAADTLGSGTHDVEVVDASYEARAGWREVTAVGDGLTLADPVVPAESVSGRLTAYPEDQLASPLDVRRAELVVGAGGALADRLPTLPAAVPDQVGRGIDRVSGWFTGLIAVERLTLPFAALALLVAAGLGTLHALAPGHGKTVMAAYLVGRQGTRRDAFLLGGTVAVTHTVGVFVLGVVLTVTAAASPARIYPWLGAASGLLFAAVGSTLFRQARRTGGHLHGPGGHAHTADGRTVPWEQLHDHDDHDHDHDPGHGHGDGHDHGDERGHDHGDGHHDHATAGAHVHAHDSVNDVEAVPVATDPDYPDVHPGPGDTGVVVADRPEVHGQTPAAVPRSAGWRGLILPGLAGGLVPSPSALLVLLAGFAIDRAGFGVGLVVAYGVGMAATLVGAGYLLLHARQRIERASASGTRRFAAALGFTRYLPLATSVLIVVGGLVIAARSLATL